MEPGSPSTQDNLDLNLDTHSVVLEYIDYTEYLPCDITRSLRLISQLDRNYGASSAAVHEIASEYCSLVDANSSNDAALDPELRSTAASLRKGIAGPLNSSLVDREESVAEAIRLYENVDRHFNRLSDIIRRLQKITVVPRPPPLRDVAQNTRARASTDPHMRITLRLDGQRQTPLKSSSTRYPTPRTSAAPVRTQAIRKRTSTRPIDEPFTTRTPSTLNRKSTDTIANKPYPHIISMPEPESSSESDWDTIPDVPPVLSDKDRKSTLSHCFTETNERLPWFELQPPELAVLRKRMKKNSSWQPSDAMMLKELDHLGRGVRGFRKWAKRSGQKKDDVTRILEGGDGSTNGIAVGALRRSQDNKGMRLNVMKRAKREREKAEAAAAAAAQTNGAQSSKLETISRKPDVANQSRASIRRTPIQAKEVLSIPTHNSGTHSRTKHGASAKPTPYFDENQDIDTNEGNPPRNVRKLRKTQVGNASTQAGDDGDDGDDMPIDPNEPTYCLCNRISFGTMVGCDNEDCPKEWFHMECVSLTSEPPKTVKWYCPLCRDDPNPAKREISHKIGKKKRKIGK